MTPYYVDEMVTVYHGDALDAPSDFRADVLVTDPPYSRAGGLHTGRSSVEGSAETALGSDQFWLHWFRDVTAEVASRMSPKACGFVFTDYRTVALVEKAFAARGLGAQMSQCLVWDRDSMGLGSPFRASHELIAFVRWVDFQWTGEKNIRNVLRFRWPYGAHENHPAEKPTELLTFLIDATTERGQLVFDPFCGSGSTLVAARSIGRRAIGIEADESYCETAARRLSQGALTEMFQ